MHGVKEEILEYLVPVFKEDDEAEEKAAIEYWTRISDGGWSVFYYATQFSDEKGVHYIHKS